jgi:hypothetical protein
MMRQSMMFIGFVEPLFVMECFSVKTNTTETSLVTLPTHSTQFAQLPHVYYSIYICHTPRSHRDETFQRRMEK